MKVKILLLVLTLYFLASGGFAQVISDKETLEDAEYFFAKEDYTEALASYNKLYKKGYKENANINYRIGICYLYSYAERDKSVQYLEKAVKNVSDKYKEGSLKEINAPVDAFLFLGNAYRITMQLDKAIETYGKFLTLANKDDIVDKNWTTSQIEACKRAKIAITKPVRTKITSLGQPINSKTASFNAVLSANENFMVYVSKLRFYDAIETSTRINGKWSNPENITPEIQSDGDQYPCFLTQDGKILYLSRHDNENSDIYISTFDGKQWSPSKPLNKEINSKYWESHACVSPDGKTLYFTSNRPQSLGGTDIFISHLTNDGWGPAENIGPEINTSVNEETPFITQDGNTLYFSSQGHDGIGGYDIFYSTKDANGKWAKPVNLGYPVNTTDDDLFYVPIGDGSIGYQAKNMKPGIGELDIVKVEVFSDRHPFKYNIEGNLAEIFKSTTPDTFSIHIVQKDKIIDSLAHLSNSAFNFNQPSGTYTLEFLTKDCKLTSNNISIPKDYQPEEFELTPEALGVSNKYIDCLVLRGEKAEEARILALKTEKKEQEAKENLINAGVIHNILFAFNEFKLTAEGENEIGNIVKLMKKNPSLVVEITGYADATGSDRYNLQTFGKQGRNG